MKRSCITWFVALCLSACSSEPEESTFQQADMRNQGPQLHGILLLGMQVQGMSMVGFQFAGATLGGAALVNVRVENGELVAEQNQVTLHGGALQYAHLYAQVRNLHANPPTSAVVEYQIAAVEAELAYDPTQTGSTFLYTLTQNVDNSGTYQLACPADSDGRQVAIPLKATWNEHGDRVESSSLFTFGCTTGAIAKCYRWGYRPWVMTYGDLVTTHQTCTRLARADYCGDGSSHTHEGTMINVWDNLAPPGPIMSRGTTPAGMSYESGWNTSGALCFSHARWALGGLTIALHCPLRLIPPSLLGLGTVCDTVEQVLGSANPRLFDETNLNINLDLL